MLCQKDIPEELRCPTDAKRSIKGVGYKTIADNLFGFSKIDSLPKTIDVTRLDDGDGVKATFQRNLAKWHDSCRLEFNSTQLVRAEKRKTPCKDIQDVPKKFTRQSVDKKPQPKDKCFFCDEQDSNDDTLREASTFELDAHVRKCALQLGDKPLLATLSTGDMIAQEAKYHTKCLVSLYNKVRDADAKTVEPDPDRMNHAVALAELVTYIDEARTDALVAPVFVLADLAALYTTLMEQLGTIMTGRVHSTKLKNRILRYFPDLEEHEQGRDVLLAFNQDLGSALQKACGQDADDDAIHLARAVNIVRRDMLKIKTASIGSFDTYCQEDSVPHTLTGLVGMVLNGSNIRDQPNHLCIPAPTLAISQLLVFNFSARRRWIVSGPEMSRVIREFQASAEKKTHRTGILHHEQTKHAQMAFVRDVKTLHCAMGEMGNPFCDESNDLLVLDSRDVADPVIITALRQMEMLGQEQYERYIEERLVNRTNPIADPIKRNNLSLFSRPPVRKKSKAQLHLSSIKNDCSLFSRLYIASQVRDGCSLSMRTRPVLQRCHRWAT